MPAFKGIKVSPGVAVGPVARLDRGIVGLHRIVSDPFRERALYEAAIVLAKDELTCLQQRAQGADADILMFQIALLEDESFTNEIGDYIAADNDSETSHAAIMARTMGIPAVFGLGKGVAALAEGRDVLIDGQAGTLTIDPTPDEIAQANHRFALLQRKNRKRHALAGKPCVTRDGTQVSLYASASSPEDIENAMHAGADAIGLVRTEQLLLDHLGEEKQYYYYINCLGAAGGRPVTVRTGDVGADDAAPWVEDVRRAAENRRRLSTQIAALLRAGTRGGLRVVLPMITGPEEWDDVMAEVERCKERLHRRGVEYDRDLEFGCLIEIPAAALVADQIMDHGAKFLAIDIDDLVRYTVAAGRPESQRGRYERADVPAVRRLVDMVCRMAADRGIPVYMCGIMAGALPEMEAYLRDGIRGFCLEWISLNDLKAEFMEIDLADDGKSVDKSNGM